MRLIGFCEAPADFRLMSGLVDRAIREADLPWVVEAMDTPEAVRTWHLAKREQTFFDVHHLSEYDGWPGVRTRGRFDGKPGRAGAAMARKAFKIALHLHRKADEGSVDLVVLLWDIDSRNEGRREGLDDAKAEAKGWAPFEIVCGLPDPASEAWVLAGFEPDTDHERKTLADAHQELGFSPVREAGKLRDKTPGAPRDIKRVLSVLTAHDIERHERCWTRPSLETLRQHGKDTGLKTFLDDLAAVLPKLLGGPPD